MSDGVRLDRWAVRIAAPERHRNGLTPYYSTHLAGAGYLVGEPAAALVALFSTREAARDACRRARAAWGHGSHDDARRGPTLTPVRVHVTIEPIDELEGAPRCTRRRKRACA